MSPSRLPLLLAVARSVAAARYEAALKLQYKHFAPQRFRNIFILARENLQGRQRQFTRQIF